MATTTARSRPARSRAGHPADPVIARVTRWIREHTLAIYSALAMIYMFLPVAVVVAVLLQQPRRAAEHPVERVLPRRLAEHLQGPDDLPVGRGQRRRIALFATIVGTILGTMISFALVRHRFRADRRRTC